MYLQLVSIKFILLYNTVCTYYLCTVYNDMQWLNMYLLLHTVLVSHTVLIINKQFDETYMKLT
jgi:hypothetical protein